MQTFTFDCELVAAIQVKAETVADARRILAGVLECADTNFGAFPDGSPVLGEVSLAEGPLCEVLSHAEDLDAACDFKKRLHAVNEHRNIKPENWQTLAGMLQSQFADSLAASDIAQVYAGFPTAEVVGRIVRTIRFTVHRTYSGNQRTQCKSLTQTLVNYGLVRADDVRDLLPE